MIDLTPLDVRNKRGDFKKLMRGYDPQEVDVFLELVAERLEALVRENIQLRDRTTTLQEQVEAQAGREQAVQDALVTAQELRKDIREQSQREADHIMREAESEARRMIAEAEAEVRSRLRGVERQMDQSRDSLQELERRRQRFLQEFRGLLQRELDVVQVEEERVPLEERAVDLDLGSRRGSSAVGSLGAGAVQDVSGVAEVASPGAEEGSAEAKEDAPVAEAVDVGGDAADLTMEAESSGSHEGTDEVAAEPIGELESPGGLGGEDEQVEAPSAEAAVDVADLEPEGMDAVGDQASPSSSRVGGEPSSLELELMAGAATDGPPGDYPEVPDLETVLAEAGIDEVRPPPAQEISPPPASQKPLDDDGRRPEDRLALFDKDKKGKKG